MSSDRRPDDAPKIPPVPPVSRMRTTPPTATEEAISKFAQGTANQSKLDKPIQTPEHAVQLAELEQALGRCLAGLTMHFQPIVSATTHARLGYEALLRSRDKSLPHPGAILDAAERLERIPMLGRAVRAQTAKVIADAPPERGIVFVNLHLLDLFDKQLTSPFSPLSKLASRVVLEITERTSLEGEADVRFRVAELRELGFKIAIDDLGGGHARMGTFTPLDCDYVKLDMSLVRDINKHQMKQRLVRSVIELCRDQGTRVIGEGVETSAEEKVLVELGCDYLQGYLIAKPAAPFVDPL